MDRGACVHEVTVRHELVTNNDDYHSHTLLPSDQLALTGMSRVLTEAALLKGQLLEVLCLSQRAAKTTGKKIRLGRGCFLKTQIPGPYIHLS